MVLSTQKCNPKFDMACIQGRWAPFDVPHIFISSDDQTNEIISNDISNDKNAGYRCYDNTRWFGHGQYQLYNNLNKKKRY